MEEAILTAEQQQGSSQPQTVGDLDDAANALDEYANALIAGKVDTQISEQLFDIGSSGAAGYGVDKVVSPLAKNLGRVTGFGARMIPQAGAAYLMYENAPVLRQAAIKNQNFFNEKGVEAGTDPSYYSNELLIKEARNGSERAYEEIARRERVSGQQIFTPVEATPAEMTSESPNFDNSRVIPEDPAADTNGDGVLSEEEIADYKISNFRPVKNPFRD